MKIGIDAVAEDPRFGMPRAHIEAFAQVAKEENTAIGVRPVSPYARSFLEAGYPTKPFVVKSKSAKIGIAAGLIVMNPRYSQVPTAEFKKHHDQLKKAFEQDHDLAEVMLILTREQIEHVRKQFGDAIKVIPKENTDGFDIEWQKEGKTIHFSAIRRPGYDDYFFLDDDQVPLTVLGKRMQDADGHAVVKPMTADYDLLVLCPSYKSLDMGGKDKTPFWTQGPPSKMRQELQRSGSGDSIGPKEDPRGGNWSQRTREMTYKINLKISEGDERRRGENIETVHHNNEFHNPFPDDLKNNLPCLLLLPVEIDVLPNAGRGANIILAETEQDLREIRRKLHEKGYYWPTHAKYRKDGSFDMLQSSAAPAISSMLMRRTSSVNLEASAKIEPSQPSSQSTPALQGDRSVSLDPQDEDKEKKRDKQDPTPPRSGGS